MAISVVITHTNGILNTPTFLSWAAASQKYGISGFFLLSAFLLTYRLIKDFEKPNSSLILSVIQYAIRRFFRIYVTAILFAIAANHGPHFFEGFQKDQYFGVMKVVTLQYPGHTVLWTIIPEIRYYFCLPFICLAYHFARRFQPILLLLGIILTAYDQSYNLFHIQWGDITCGQVKNYFLYNHFFVFLIGTLLAMAYLLVEKYERLLNLFKTFQMQVFFIGLSLSLIPYAIYYHSGLFLNEFEYR